MEQRTLTNNREHFPQPEKISFEEISRQIDLFNLVEREPKKVNKLGRLCPTTRKVGFTPISKFIMGVEKAAEGGCWLWTGGRSKRGYSTITVEKKQTTVHKFIWEFVNDTPVPDGKELRRTCGNPFCINPTHFEPATRFEIMSARRQEFCVRGHALTDENVYVHESERRSQRYCNLCKAVLASEAAPKRKQRWKERYASDPEFREKEKAASRRRYAAKRDALAAAVSN
ncbi:MAG TPA: hypothetical protein VF648_09785 [Pyrinomonadaceae bacterium]|jgi:hypothetical protein